MTASIICTLEAKWKKDYQSTIQHHYQRTTLSTLGYTQFQTKGEIISHTHMYTINILHLPEYKRNAWKMPPWPKYLQSFSKISKENICNRVHSYKIAPPPLSRWQIMKKFLPSVKGKKYKYHVNSLQISTTGMASEVSVCLRFLSGSVCQ